MTKLFKVTYYNPEMIKYWLDQYFAVFIKPEFRKENQCQEKKKWFK